MSDKECRAQEALAQLLAVWAEEWRGPWGPLADLITSTALARGVTGESLIRLLRDDSFVLGAQGQHDAQPLLRLRDAIVAVLADDSCVPRLFDLLDSPTWRGYAAAMLGWYGPAARAALPSLVDVASMGSWASRRGKESVVLIGGAEEEIARQLRDSVTDGDDGNFRELCDLAFRAGYGSSGWLLQTVEAAGRSENADIRWWVPVVIERLSAEDRRKLRPTLQRLSVDPVDYVRESAREVPDD